MSKSVIALLKKGQQENNEAIKKLGKEASDLTRRIAERTSSKKDVEDKIAKLEQSNQEIEQVLLTISDNE